MASALTLDAMFAITESDAAAIREAFAAGGELAAAVELRRRIRGLEDNAQARACARAIAAWEPAAYKLRDEAAKTRRASPQDRGVRPAGSSPPGHRA